MPLSFQEATAKAVVVLGPTQGYARAPYWLAVGPTRSADDLDLLKADADAIARLFEVAPCHWNVAAQATMSLL
jgi:hypothetical protein